MDSSEERNSQQPSLPWWFHSRSKKKERCTTSNKPVSGTVLRVGSPVRAIKTGRAVTEFNIFRHQNRHGLPSAMAAKRKNPQIKRIGIALHSKRSLTKRELQSLVGLLQFVTQVIRPGRPFLQRLYTMQQIGSSPSHHIHLNAPTRADMLWWLLFMNRWNGISILWDLQRQATASLSV